MSDDKARDALEHLKHLTAKMLADAYRSYEQWMLRLSGDDDRRKSAKENSK